jgi:hypothetical protein
MWTNASRRRCGSTAPSAGGYSRLHSSRESWTSMLLICAFPHTRAHTHTRAHAHATMHAHAHTHARTHALQGLGLMLPTRARAHAERAAGAHVNALPGFVCAHVRMCVVCCVRARAHVRCVCCVCARARRRFDGVRMWARVGWGSAHTTGTLANVTVSKLGLAAKKVKSSLAPCTMRAYKMPRGIQPATAYTMPRGGALQFACCTVSMQAHACTLYLIPAHGLLVAWGLGGDLQVVALDRVRVCRVLVLRRKLS